MNLIFLGEASNGTALSLSAKHEHVNADSLKGKTSSTYVCQYPLTAAVALWDLQPHKCLKSQRHQQLL